MELIFFILFLAINSSTCT